MHWLPAKILEESKRILVSYSYCQKSKNVGLCYVELEDNGTKGRHFCPLYPPQKCHFFGKSINSDCLGETLFSDVFFKVKFPVLSCTVSTHCFDIVYMHCLPIACYF